MNKKYEKLFESLMFPSGIETKNRFAMAPMTVYGSNDDDTIGKEDLDYFSVRNDTGGLIITGATTTSKDGHGISKQITAYDDKKIGGLTKLASVIKGKGNLAILQLQNAGRESRATYSRKGITYAPSRIEFPFLKYVPEELSPKKIKEFIKDYGEATRRAIEAGFDGVEIHGANHYLIQQFFSAYSNRRKDQWGGSLTKRMNFALEVVDEINNVVENYAEEPFLVGYRISPEEVHGENIGYTVDEAAKLVNEIIKSGIDYIHLSMNQYDAMPLAGGNNEALATTIYKTIDGRVPLIGSGKILTPDDALDALNYFDIVALGRAVIIDPEFTVKISEGREDEIEMSVENRFENIYLPEKLKRLWTRDNTPLPPLKGLNSWLEYIVVNQVLFLKYPRTLK